MRSVLIPLIMPAIHCMRHAIKEAPVAQLDRALPSEGRGREFESRRVRQFFQIKQHVS